MCACVWLTFVLAGPIGAGQRADLVYPCRPAHKPVAVRTAWDDPAWQGAPVAGGFVVHPGASGPADPPTHFRARHDAQALYLSVLCYEPDLSTIVTRHKRHDDPVYMDDSVELFVDPKHDHRTYWQLIANAAGARYDSIRQDPSWSGPWQAHAGRCQRGWSLAVTIPFNSLGAPPPAEGTAWGFNCCRNRWKGRQCTWSQWAETAGGFHAPNDFGHLLFTRATTHADLVQACATLRQKHGRLRIVVDDGHLVVEPNGTFTHTTYEGRIRASRQRLRRRLGEVEALARQLEGVIPPAKLNKVLGDARRTLDRADRARGLSSLPLGQALRDAFDQVDELYWQLRLEQVLSEP